MGLSVSQVRLLALTNRKADIELRMQVDTKRKMMLTRKSTELAQQYYSRLNCATIQYATTAGYEDVNYNYLMGETKNNEYTAEFIQGIATASSKTVKKPANNMVLIDQMGRVIVNDYMAKLIEKTRDEYNGETNNERVCNAILDMVDDYKNSMLNTGESLTSATAASFISSLYTDDLFPEFVDESKKQALRDNMVLLLKNGGYNHGGVIYISGSSTDAPSGAISCYASAEDARISSLGAQIYPQKGYMYQVRNQDGYLCSSEAFYGQHGFDTSMSVKTAQYLGNLIDYFAPIISAGLQNGISTKVIRTPIRDDSNITDKKLTAGMSDEEKMGLLGLDTHLNTETGLQAHNDNRDNNQVFRICDEDGNAYFFKACIVTDTAGNESWKLYQADSDDYYIYQTEGEGYDDEGNTKQADNSTYRSVLDTETLQARFKSGLCQLAMVTDKSKGTYHKNTTMTYFTHMNYVVEKTDTSKKEELTAWFNKEQAAISEQETYWDTEIQNLSTELSSVNTEIQSVKQLKSDSIKSVFNWGE